MSTIKLNTTGGSGGSVALKGPASTTGDGDVELTLPVDDGTADQYLKTDGSGALSWSTVSGGIETDNQNNTYGGPDAGNTANWGTDATDNTLVGHDAGTAITTADFNVCLGSQSGKTITTGGYNIAIGNLALGTGTVTAAHNIAIGNEALEDCTSGSSNTAIGLQALTENTTGHNNVAIGQYALQTNVDGAYNVAVGQFALQDGEFDVNEGWNTAIGYGASAQLTTGESNTTVGYLAGGSGIMTGDGNTAIGRESLQDCTSGANNVAIGRSALANLQTGDNNIAIGKDAALNADAMGKGIYIGFEAGKANNVGNNIAIGDRALRDGTSVSCRSNIAIGYRAMLAINGYSNIGIGGDCCGGGASGTGTSAFYNVALGDNSLMDLSTGDNNTCIGVSAGDDINTGYDNVCVGHTAGNYIQSGFDNVFIGRDTTAAAEGDDGAVVVGANIGSKGSYKAFIGGSSGAYNEQNYSTWSTTSDRRIKKNITNNTIGLDKINQITVRNFEYKKFKKDSDGIYLKDSFKKDSDGNYEKDSDGNYIPENPNGKYIPETADDEITWSEFNGGNTQSDSIIVKKIGTQIGVIAQELESVLPGLVETDAKHGLKSVNTDNLIWYLVNAVKELSTKIDALEAG